MKEIQILVSIDVSDDEFSQLMNPNVGLTVETLIFNAMKNGAETYSFDFPSLSLDLPDK